MLRDTCYVIRENMTWLHNYTPQSILLTLGPVKIHWYGLLMAVAVFVCLRLAIKLAKFRNLDQNHIFNLSFYLIIFGIIGARVWHVLFYNFSYFLNHPFDIVKLWQGGLAVHGSMAAGALVTYFYAKKHHLNFWRLADLLAVVLPLGQAIGRWGNYFNQELFGKSCDFNWCIPIGRGASQYFHPVFLYESILNLILFVGLFVIYRSKKAMTGVTTFVYLIGYSVIRFFMEFLRLDVSQTYLGLKWVQWLCLLIIVSVIGIYKFQRKDFNPVIRE